MPWRFPLRPPVVVAPKPAPPPPPPPVEEVAELEEGAVVTTTRWTLRWLFWRALLWILLALGIRTAASLMPQVVELIYSQKLYFFIVRFQSFVSRFFPFSLGEVFWGALVIWFVVWTIWYLRRSMRGEARFFDVVKLLFLHLMWTFASLHLIFLLLWGLNFQRMPIDETWGLDRRPARTDELQAIGAQIVNGINQNYAAASENQDWAGVSRLPLTIQRLNQVIETSFNNTAALGAASQGGLSTPKNLRLSRMASYFGLGGVYMPFSGEPTYNEEVPASELPFVIANQKAHQRGFAREDEANFVAYVICTSASDPYVRYSGYMHAVKVLDVIERAGVGRYKDLIGPGPSADMDARRGFWGTMKSPDADIVMTQLINAYLRLNRVRRGVDNYYEDIPLIVSYHLRYPNRE